MSIFDHLIPVTAGQELRVWYNEDLENENETDYNGRVRADVYVYFMKLSGPASFINACFPIHISVIVELKEREQNIW